MGLGWAIVGVAWGTVMAEAAGVVAGLSIVAAHFGGRVGVARRIVFDREKFLRMIAVNRDIMIRTLALLAAWAFFARQGALAGDVTLAANAVLNNFFLLGGFFLDGVATAAEQLCGRSVGANNARAFDRAVKLSIGWSFALAGGMSLLLYLAGGLFIDLMAKSPEVQAMARAFLPYAAATPLAGALAFTYDGIYVGATWNAAMRNMMILSLALFFCLWWVLLPLGNHGLWLSVLGFLLLRGATQALAYPGLRRREFQPKGEPG
jgi:MATE family multidrug resistance protein